MAGTWWVGSAGSPGRSPGRVHASASLHRHHTFRAPDSALHDFLDRNGFLTSDKVLGLTPDPSLQGG